MKIRNAAWPVVLLILCLGANDAPAEDPKAWLNAHNGYRSKHCVPNLTWSAQVAASAQTWANACTNDHEKASVYGENLFRGTANAYSPQFAVKSWYDEIAQYNYGAPGNSKPTGHFTQVVWKNTKQVGCAKALCNGMDYWVCRYAPAGNVDDPAEFTQNVLRASCDYRIESVPKPPPKFDPHQPSAIESVPVPRKGTGDFMKKMQP